MAIARSMPSAAILLHGVGDERLPIAHADVDGHAQLARTAVRLLQRPAGERRVPDQAVAMPDFFDDFAAEAGGLR